MRLRTILLGCLLLAMASAVSVQAQFTATAVYNTTTGAADTIRVNLALGGASSLADGDYPTTVHITCAGSPSGCNYDGGTFHPYIHVSGGTPSVQCTDCAGGASYIFQGGVTSAMPCFSGGVMTFSGGSVTTGVVTVTASSGTVTRNDQGSGGGATVGGTITLTASGCTSPVHVTAHWVGARPALASAVLNIDLGGVLVQVSCNSGGCGSATISQSVLNALGAAPYSVNSAGIMGTSWALNSFGQEATPTLHTPFATSVACGGTLDIGIDSNLPGQNPTPTPNPTATVSPSATITPYPTPDATATPPVFTTPPPWPSIPPGMPGGGDASGSLTKGDIYDAVRQALVDAGNDGTGQFQSGNGGVGSYDTGAGSGTGGDPTTHLAGDIDDAITAQQSSVSSTLDNINGNTLSLPTAPSAESSMGFTLPYLGSATLDLSNGTSSAVAIFRGICQFCIGVLLYFGLVHIVRSGIA